MDDTVSESVRVSIHLHLQAWGLKGPGLTHIEFSVNCFRGTGIKMRRNAFRGRGNVTEEEQVHEDPSVKKIVCSCRLGFLFPL